MKEWLGYAYGGDNQAIFHIMETSTAPLLIITNSGNQAVVSWPPALTGWTLQTNSNLATNSWGNYTGQISSNSVTIISSAGTPFFRLTGP